MAVKTLIQTKFQMIRINCSLQVTKTHGIGVSNTITDTTKHHMDILYSTVRLSKQCKNQNIIIQQVENM